MSKKDFRSGLPWYRAKFDLEGLGFGGLALALAIIVGSISYIGWVLSILCWIALVIILFASRDSERTPPTENGLVLSPCDGVVTDISTVPPAREVRWDMPEVKRVRISSSPFSVNGMRAPISGNIESFLEEEGAPSALSMNADDTDLREAFILFAGEEGVCGVRIATGGLGPRLDIDLEAGDSVRAGRKIGVRRLGGWCDVYLPLSATVHLQPGMSVVGGETILSDISGLDIEHKPFVREPEAPVEDPKAEPEPIKEAESEETPEQPTDSTTQT